MHNCTCILLTSRVTPVKGLPSPASWRYWRKLFTLMRCILWRYCRKSGFQNRVELLTMHNYTCILLSRRLTPEKALPSPTVAVHLRTKYITKVHLSGFQNRVELLTIHNLYCLAPYPAGWRYCRKLSITEDARPKCKCIYQDFKTEWSY